MSSNMKYFEMILGVSQWHSHYTYLNSVYFLISYMSSVTTAVKELRKMSKYIYKVAVKERFQQHKQWKLNDCFLLRLTEYVPSPNLLNPGTPTGRGSNLLSKRIFWLSKPVRYASECRLQSAGEAKGGAVGHQTDTWHITAGLWKWYWWMGSSRTEEHSFWTIPLHAGTTEQLYTSLPGDKAVR
jgi:hypothetical protein